MRNTLLYITLLMFVLSSCFKEDEMIPAHDPGDLIEAEVDLGGGGYPLQVYFNLSDSSTVASNNRVNWDLAFESSEEGWHIFLNSSCFMWAGATGITDFEASIDTTGLNWKYDPSDGNSDSTAIGQYFSINSQDSAVQYTNEVYVIDRGLDSEGTPRGLKRLSILQFNDSAYSIRYANLDGSEKYELDVIKDPSRVFSYLSFDGSGSQYYPEPPKEEYDLLFTNYTTLLYTDAGEPVPYLVVGVLLNRYSVEAYRDIVMNFDEITYETALGLELTNRLDEIGYDWKDYVGELTQGVYVIVEGLNYIIRDTEGFYYKLRFTSFYDSNGEKGHPSFEYQRL